MGSKTIKDITATQTTINDDDYFELQETAGTSKKTIWSTIKSNLKSYFDAFYTPIGSIIMYAVETAPTNYLICNGAAISRTTYASLFAVIGTVYGIGDNSTTFNIPNYQAVVPKGSGTQTINTRSKSGPAFAAVEEDGLQDHGHNTTVYAAAGGAFMGGISTYGSDRSGTSYQSTSLVTAGGGSPRGGTTTRENSIGTNFCIRYQ